MSGIEELKSGEIVYLNQEKGYGFARRDGGIDYFFHFCEWTEDESVPTIGMKVQFEIAKRQDGEKKRPRAINVSLLRVAATVLNVLSGTEATKKEGDGGVQ